MFLSLGAIACRNRGIDSVSSGDERREPTYAIGELPTSSLIKHVLGWIPTSSSSSACSLSLSVSTRASTQSETSRNSRQRLIRLFKACNDTAVFRKPKPRLWRWRHVRARVRISASVSVMVDVRPGERKRVLRRARLGCASRRRKSKEERGRWEAFIAI